MGENGIIYEKETGHSCLFFLAASFFLFIIFLLSCLGKLAEEGFVLTPEATSPGFLLYMPVCRSDSALRPFRVEAGESCNGSRVTRPHIGLCLEWNIIIVFFSFSLQDLLSDGSNCHLQTNRAGPLRQQLITIRVLPEHLRDW